MKMAQQIYNTTSELCSIQRTRMKLGVIHLSDITTADGQKMDQTFYAIALPRIQRNQYDWPIKHYTNKEDVALWRRLLKNIYCGGNNSLPIPLGQWIEISTVDWLDK